MFVTFYYKTHPKIGSRLLSRVSLINHIACIGGGGGDGEEEVNRAPRKESEEDDVGVYVLIETDVSCVHHFRFLSHLILILLHTCIHQVLSTQGSVSLATGLG